MNTAQVIGQNPDNAGIQNEFEYKKHYSKGVFYNYWQNTRQIGFSDIMKWQFGKIFNSIKDSSSFENYYEHPLPSVDSNKISVTYIGHATVLIRINNITILTDPFFSDRASPVSFAGPKRVIDPRPTLEEIGEIDYILISHDHYDHLDEACIKEIGNNPKYIVPLGVEQILKKWGISNFVSMDWGQTIQEKNIKFYCLPAQHFSGRGTKRNNTLWCSLAFRIADRTVYFGADTGYGPHFKWIAEQFGHIDLAILPIGAYIPQYIMKPVHTNPEEAVQAFVDLGADYAIPIHWGTIKLSDEPMDEPPVKLKSELERRGIALERFPVLRHGETLVF